MKRMLIMLVLMMLLMSGCNKNDILAEMSAMVP